MHISNKYFLPVYKYFCVQHWLEPGKRVSQQIKGISPVTLYLGVKFYAADPCKLAEEVTRYIHIHNIYTHDIYNIYRIYQVPVLPPGEARHPPGPAARAQGPRRGVGRPRAPV